MKVTTKIIQIFLTIILLWGGFGCDNFLGLGIASSNIVSLSELQQLEISEDDSIYIQGKVVKTVPLLESNAYQIQDNTDTVWVITQGKSPSIDQNLTIKGKLKYQSIPINQQELGEFYLVEEEIVKTE
jgi:hypothetical protein